MKFTTSIPRSLLLFLSCVAFVTSASAGNKGFVIAMGWSQWNTGNLPEMEKPW